MSAVSLPYPPWARLLRGQGRGDGWQFRLPHPTSPKRCNEIQLLALSITHELRSKFQVCYITYMVVMVVALMLCFYDAYPRVKASLIILNHKRWWELGKVQLHCLKLADIMTLIKKNMKIEQIARGDLIFAGENSAFVYVCLFFCFWKCSLCRINEIILGIQSKSL